MANHTRNRWTQDTPNSDLQLMVGPSSWQITAGAPTRNLNSNVGTWNFPGGSAASFTLAADLTLLLRTGMYASPSLDQQQFGTAALQPGPSSVANTSDPLGIRNFPPYKNVNNPIYGASAGINGPVPKGIQINWVDYIFVANWVPALASISVGIYASYLVNGQNLNANQTAIIANGQNGLPLAGGVGTLSITRVNIANPAFIITNDTIVTAQISATTGTASSGGIFIGAVLGCSFNFN